MAKTKTAQTMQRAIAFAAVSIMVGCLAVAALFAQNTRKADDERIWEFAALFAEVYKNIDDRYVEEVDKKKLLEGALQGMFLTLDPHSQYMVPDSLSQLTKDTEGAFSGIGIHISMKDGFITCVSPMPGSPAAKAGMRPWDRIIEINGKKTQGMSLQDAVRKLTGPAGTTVKVGVFRAGERELIPFELVRGNIRVDSVYHTMLTPEIGYMRLAKFSENTTRDLSKAIEDCREKGAKGLLLDLRNNSGGLLNEAVDVSNLFLPKGKLIVSTKGRIADANREFKAAHDPVTDLPLIVLVNQSSASASEIVAGALKDYQRGLVLGIKDQRTYGKGSVQTIQDLRNSFEKDENGNITPAGLRLTTAHYFTPANIKIDKLGVTPDIAVEMPKDNGIDLLKFGMFGDPEQNDSATTGMDFTWKKYDDTHNADESKTPAPEDVTTTTTTDEKADGTTSPEEDDEMSLIPSALTSKNDKNTTDAKARRVIPLDRELFPTAVIEDNGTSVIEAMRATLTSTTVERSAFVDYQLKVAERLMSDKLEKGIDFYDDLAAMPAKFDPPTTATATTTKE